MDKPLEQQIFDRLTADSTENGGLSDHDRKAEPGSFVRHILALSGSKLADGLIDPKLVLSWLLTHLAAGPFWTGLLVPVREAGALLPQLFIADWVHQLARRKWAWAGGAVAQAAATAGIIFAALTLEGWAAGLAIVALLGILALARSVCSVSYKDVLGKTVGKARRGTATGTASAVASAGVIVFALVLMTGWGDRLIVVLGALTLAVLCWGFAGAAMAGLDEEPDKDRVQDTRGLAHLTLLRSQPQLARFVAARSALVGTALAPPYLVILSGAGASDGVEQLGALVLASALASLLSSYVWGRMSDRSSRHVLIWSGAAGAAALFLALGLHFMGSAGAPFAMPLVLFGLMIAYHGVRQGRSTHLVDMAGPDDRAAYTAVSNTIVGLVVLGAGAGFAGLAVISVPLAIGVMAVLCLGGAVLAHGLEEVQHDN